MRRELAEKARRAALEMSPEALTARNKKISEAHKRGCYDQVHESMRGKPGRPQSPETRKLLSQIGKSLNYRRLTRNTVEYCGVLLDSSWEVKLAQWLDERSIAWTRPDPLEYGEGRKYYPDFYLPEFDLYLDPKNDYLIKLHTDKIEKAAKQNNVEILILSRSDLMSLGVM